MSMQDGIYTPTIEPKSVVTVKGEAFVRKYVDDIATLGGFVNRDRTIDYEGFGRVIAVHSHTKPATQQEVYDFAGTFEPQMAADTAKVMRTQWRDINRSRVDAHETQIWD